MRRNVVASGGNEAHQAEAAPIVAELRRDGFDIVTIRDLIGLGQQYRDAIPMLAERLQGAQSSSLKDEIVRTLSVPWAVDAAPILIEQFKRANDPTGFGLRWVIGNALEVTANPNVRNDLLALATEREYGPARQMVVLGLGRLKDDPRVVEILIGLLSDPDVAGHAVMALGRIGDPAASEAIAPLVGHPRAWVRREAKKALARLGGGVTHQVL